MAAAPAAVAVIISIAVIVTVLTRPIYYFDIEKLDIPQKSGISAEACRLNYDTLIDYNLPGGESELVFPTLPMSEEGRIHFAEVKDIFSAMQFIAAAGIILIALWVWRWRHHTLWIKYTVILTIVAAGVAGLAMTIDWEWAFETMHKIFFDNDYWLFDPHTDPVITILPEEFFMHCGIFIVVLISIETFGLGIIYRRMNTCRN